MIVVDDGSGDRTRAIALELAAQEPAVRVIVHDDNLAQLEDFLPFAGDHDLIVGRRMPRMDPLGRRVVAIAWNWLVDAVFGLSLRDVDCAFKLVRADLVKDLPLTSCRAMISTELVLRCLAQGARLQEVGVRHRPRRAGRQSGTNPRVVARAFRELLSARRELGTLRHAH